jgi:hypothetical protein
MRSLPCRLHVGELSLSRVLCKTLKHSDHFGLAAGHYCWLKGKISGLNFVFSATARPAKFFTKVGRKVRGNSHDVIESINVADQLRANCEGVLGVLAGMERLSLVIVLFVSRNSHAFDRNQFAKSNTYENQDARSNCCIPFLGIAFQFHRQAARSIRNHPGADGPADLARARWKRFLESQ